jgi:hypothetical protein
VNALANDQVGRYLNRHFVSAFQKVATFQINGQQKNGGNVAAYFCTPGGLVLHTIAGPVNAATFLREANWVHETYQMAALHNQKTLGEMRAHFRRAHYDRLKKDQHAHVPSSQLQLLTYVTPSALAKTLEKNHSQGLNNQGKVHLLQVVAPLPRIEQLYQVVFEKILNEKITTTPVLVAGK